MKVVCVWKENTDYAREVREWLADYKAQMGSEVESLDPETIDGEIFARAHDVVEYPSILAVDDASTTLKMWRGTPLPQVDEVAYYVREV